MKIQRTENTTRNMFWGFGSSIIKMLLPFVARTALLKLLGEQYLGLNGLFSSILQVLNLADLGFGSAIVYSMYKPIANDDENAVCSLLALYKKIYRVIGVVILTLGLSLLPFLDNMIAGDVPADVNIRIVYLIYLLNTVISYWMFAYKGSLLSAHQRVDVKNKISTVILFIQYGLQLGLLFVFDNYYLYLISLPIVTMLSNIATAIAVKKLYPQYVCKGTAPDDVKQGIKKQVGGLFLSKVCGTTRNSLDSVFISSFVGLSTVAMYGNYYYILNSVHSMLSVVGQSVLGGVGNSVAKESVDKNYADFNKMNFLYSWCVGWCCCCMLCLYQHFMRLWVGESLMFSFPTMILFCVYLYAQATTDIKNVYVDACGLWWESRKRSVLETVVNFILNLVLGWFFGVVGILLATLITIVFINLIYGTKILFDNYFKEMNILAYFGRHICFFAVTVAASVVTLLVCELLPTNGYVYLALKLVICVVLPNALFFLIYFRTKPFKEAAPLLIRVFSKVLKKS